MFVFRPFCMAHSFVVASHCSVLRTRTGAGVMNLSKSRSTVEAPWPTSHRVSLIHDADAFLVGGRAAPPTNPCTGSRDNAPQKCSQFMELIGSVVVPVPADLHATCMNQFRVVWGRRYNL